MKSGEQNESEVRISESVACGFCGHYGAFEIGGQFLCPRCYESCGSCCPEFGREDLEARVNDASAD